MRRCLPQLAVPETRCSEVHLRFKFYLKELSSEAKKQCFLRLRGVSRVTSSRSGDVWLSCSGVRGLCGSRGFTVPGARFLRDVLDSLPESCMGVDFLLNCLTHDDFIARGQA